jgi:hypothetical protein
MDISPEQLAYEETLIQYGIALVWMRPPDLDWPHDDPSNRAFLSEARAVLVHHIRTHIDAHNLSTEFIPQAAKEFWQLHIEDPVY